MQDSKMNDFPGRQIWPKIGAVTMLLLLGCGRFGFGQRHFDMQEKEMIQKYKMSNGIYLKGKELFVKEKYAKAEKELLKSLQELPEHVEANYLMSRIMFMKKEYPQALEYIQNAKKHNKFMTDLLVYSQDQYFALLREQQKQNEETLSGLRAQLQTAAPGGRQKIQSQIRSVKSTQDEIQTRLSRPIAYAEKIPAEHSNFCGVILIQLKRYQEAHDEFTQAIESDPEYVTAYNNLINLYIMAKQYQKGTELIQRARDRKIAIDPALEERIRKAEAK